MPQGRRGEERSSDTCAWCSLRSIELLELFERRRSGQWQVPSVAGDDVLSLAAEDEAQELAQPRLDRPAGRAVEEDMDASRQWIRPVLERLARREHVGAAFARSERERFDGSDALRLRHHGPGDAVAIVRQLVA